jgi:precorrin-4/cobalt-precorrin-4 C11-methyltransferase
MSLDEIEAAYLSAHQAGHDITRLHSGDLSVWSAVAEQIRRLQKHGIPYTLTPGVPSFAAAAASLGRELTIPEVAQSLVLTRVSGRASKMPPGETLAGFGRTGATIAVHLAIHAIDRVVADLSPLYGSDCPVAIVFRASWPDERIITGTLATIEGQLKADPIERTAIIFVGRSLAANDFTESSLYDAYYQRRFRGRDGL